MNTLLLVLALTATQPETVTHPDPVIAKVLAHIDAKPIVVVVDASTVSPAMWKRVKGLNAFRVHRPDGTTDAPIFIVRNGLYSEAAKSLNTSASDVWCRLAAVIMHELEHNAPDTEAKALAAETAQIRECIKSGHFHSRGDLYAMELLRKGRHAHK